jgi:hypothetical protein
MAFGTVLRQSYIAFRSLQYSYVDKENTLESNQCGSRSETLSLSLQICGFAICGLGHQGHLRICKLRTNHYKFADLRTGTHRKLADLRLWK